MSLGSALYLHDGRAKSDLIKNADAALYAAKHGGRNRTLCFGELDKRARAKAAG